MFNMNVEIANLKKDSSENFKLSIVPDPVFGSGILNNIEKWCKENNFNHYYINADIMDLFDIGLMKEYFSEVNLSKYIVLVIGLNDARKEIAECINNLFEVKDLTQSCDDISACMRVLYRNDIDLSNNKPYLQLSINR